MAVVGGEVVLIRHGETEWSASGKHTGTTDIPLTDLGVREAREMGGFLARRDFALVLSSPRQRALRTAALAGLSVPIIDDDLVEWDYGGYEGMTTPEIRQLREPDWTVWNGGVIPGNTPGETVEEVGKRTARVIERVLPLVEANQDVALAAHGHVLRILAATWLRLPPSYGAHLRLETASVSALGFEHDNRVIRRWNITSDLYF